MLNFDRQDDLSNRDLNGNPVSCHRRFPTANGCVPDGGSWKKKKFYANCIDFAIKPHCLLQCNGHDVQYAIMDAVSSGTNGGHINDHGECTW